MPFIIRRPMLDMSANHIPVDMGIKEYEITLTHELVFMEDEDDNAKEGTPEMRSTVISTNFVNDRAQAVIYLGVLFTIDEKKELRNLYMVTYTENFLPDYYAGYHTEIE